MWLNTLCGPAMVDSGSGAIFRGDFLHGGMSWDCKSEEPHLHLFLKVNTDLFCRGCRKRKSFYLLDNHEIKHPGNVVCHEDTKKSPVLQPLSDSHSVMDLTIDNPQERDETIAKHLFHFAGASVQLQMTFSIAC